MKVFLSYPGLFTIRGGKIEFLPFGFQGPNPEAAAEALMKIRNGKKIDELEKIITGEKGEKLLLGSEQFLPILRQYYSKINFRIMKDWQKIKQARERISAKLYEIFGGREEYVNFANKTSRKIARERLSKAGEKKDLIISETVTLTEELAKMVNNLVSHLKDFYGYHFPELEDIVEDNETYVKIIASTGSKGEMSVEKLENLTESKDLAHEIVEAKKLSVKAGFKEETVHLLQEIARKALALSNLRGFLLNHLEKLMREGAPNITTLVGPTIGAKLIKEIGGLGKMAKSPSSTIQVVGAEKALFRAMHGKGTPPKHGIIFQDPRIHNAPEEQRGKIARAIANKLAIAARIDYFSNKDKSEKLKQELKDRIEEIKQGGR